MVDSKDFKYLLCSIGIVYMLMLFIFVVFVIHLCCFYHSSFSVLLLFLVGFVYFKYLDAIVNIQSERFEKENVFS